MPNPIAISLSPNTKKSDLFLAIKLLFSPWRWREGEAIALLEREFCKFLKVNFAISFNSGRSSEYAILKALGVGRGDEVLIQAFTCVSVPNSIIWTGAKPVFVDIKEETLNMDPMDLQRKITPKARVIIVQHTFGRPAELEKILTIAKKKNLYVIEDCAHALGVAHKKRKLGSFTDAAFFSFGRDKAISSVFGGMVVTKKKDLGRRLRNLQKGLVFPSYFWIFQQLLHPIAFAAVLPIYNFCSLGKILLFFLQKARLLSLAVEPEEKQGKKLPFYPLKLPNAQACLALFQLGRIKDFNKKRKTISEFYTQALRNLPIKLPKPAGFSYLRYTIRTRDAPKLWDFAKKQGVLLGTWYSNIVDPKGVDFRRVNYRQGSCPVAEKVSPQVLNLPTYPKMTLEDARKVVQIIKEYYKHRYGNKRSY